MTRRGLVMTLMIGATILVGDQSAFACSCIMSGPPCQATWSADAVFAGTVVSMTPLERDASRDAFQSLLVRFQVDRAFVPASAAFMEVATGMGGGDCGYRFKVGQKYLVYANRNSSSQRLTTGICSRTRPLAEAAEDLQYLATIGRPSGGARVYGRINEMRRDPAEATAIDYGPVEGIPVSLRGAGFSRETTTDANGRFSFIGVPLGKAAVRIVLPFGFEPNPFERDVEIRDPRACGLVDLAIQQFVKASGTVVDAAGRNVPGVMVDAVAAELAGFMLQPYQQPARTNQNGVFEFRALPPGAYVFGVNLTRNPVTRGLNGPAIYLPGTRVASEAAVFELKAGDQKDIGTLRLTR